MGFIAFTIFSNIASAQLVSIGALGGVPITDTTGRNDESRPYTVGGSVEVRLPAGFALEADALYRRVGSTLSFLSIGGTPSLGIDRRRGNSWEFPLLGKYYFRRTSAWQPFFGTGFAFRTIDIHEDGSVLSGAPITLSPFSGGFREPLNAGATVAGGLRLHYSRLAILPQIRYTRWGGVSGVAPKNETSFLLGVSF